MGDFDDFDEFFVEEVGIAMFSPALRKIVTLLEALDAAQGHSAAQWGSTRTPIKRHQELTHL